MLIHRGGYRSMVQPVTQAGCSWVAWQGWPASAAASWPCLQLELPLLTMTNLLASTCSLLLRDVAKSSYLYPLWSAPFLHLKIPTQLCHSSWWNNGVRGSLLLPFFCQSDWICPMSVQDTFCSAWRLGLLLFCLFPHYCFNNKPTSVAVSLTSLSPKGHSQPSSKHYCPRTTTGVCWMTWPGVLAKPRSVFIFSGFKETEAHLFNIVSQSINFFLLNNKAESLADYGLWVVSSESLPVCLKLSFVKFNYRGRSALVLWRIEGVKSSNFLARYNLKSCWGTIWGDYSRAGGRLFS